jgi:hypothetical protein
MSCFSSQFGMRAVHCVTLVLACIPRLSQTSVNGDESPQGTLVGVWGTELNLGPLVRGRLLIDGRQAQWRAAIAGFNVPVQHTREAVTFFLPGGAGESRGRLNANSNSVNVEWIQSPGLVNHNRYATPVHMALLSPGAWSGEVVPPDERSSFYISIRSRTNGSLTAVIVNPEYNMFRRRSYDVVLNKYQITLTNRKRPDDGFTGTYGKASDRLVLPLLDSYPPLALSRRNGDTAFGFYARTLAASQYVYRRPVASDDGWPTASLAEVGIAEQLIAALIERVLTADPADNPVRFDSLLVARHEKLVLEEYFHGYDGQRPHDMRSASKTFAPVLVSAARSRSAALSPQTTVFPLFTKDEPFAHWDRKSHLTLKDLMTMTSGLASDDNDDASPPRHRKDASHDRRFELQDQDSHPRICVPAAQDSLRESILRIHSLQNRVSKLNAKA